MHDKWNEYKKTNPISQVTSTSVNNIVGLGFENLLNSMRMDWMTDGENRGYGEGGDEDLIRRRRENERRRRERRNFRLQLQRC